MKVAASIWMIGSSFFQSLRRAMSHRSRPQRAVYQPGDWIMAWRKENQWFGPLTVIFQEDKNVLWAVLGNKLFRLAPEHARPLSAVEEVRHAKVLTSRNISHKLENLRPGPTRFVDVLNDIVPSPAQNQPVREQPFGLVFWSLGRSVFSTCHLKNNIKKYKFFTNVTKRDPLVQNSRCLKITSGCNNMLFYMFFSL